MGLSVVAVHAALEITAAMKTAFVSLGVVWTLGAIYVAATAAFNRKLHHVTSRTAGFAIAFVSVIFAAANWYYFLN